MSEVQSGRLFCVPYEIQRPGESTEAAVARAGVILDHMVAHPVWFATPMEQSAIRESAAWLLTHPEHQKFEIWLGGKLVGMILLSRLVPQCDVLLHFTLFGISLLSARQLLWNFLGTHCFGTLGLQRVSFEVPEHVTTLAKFMRSRLAFRYESELDLDRVPFAGHLVEYLKDKKQAGRFHMQDPATALAKLGSRRECIYWDPQAGVWRDMLLLRLLKAEYLAHSTPRADSQATESPVSEPSSHARTEASAVPANHPA